MDGERKEGESNAPGCHEFYLLSSWLDVQPEVMLWDDGCGCPDGCRPVIQIQNNFAKMLHRPLLL